MKQMIIILMCMMIISVSSVASPAVNKSINDSSVQDPYKLPEYNKNFQLKSLWGSSKKLPSAVKKNANAPALTIINEPYNPEPVFLPTQSDLTTQQIANEKATAPETLWVSDDEPAVITPSPMTANIVTMEPKTPIKTVDTWRARKGESLYQILSRWSERAGTKMTWSSIKSPRLDKNISFVGTYQDAVTHVMKVAGASGIKSEWNTEPKVESSPEIVEAYAPESLSSTPLINNDLGNNDLAVLDEPAPIELVPIEPQQALPQRARFYALAGTSLEQVLRSWAGSQEFGLVWQADRNFAVKETVSSNGEAEDAIRDILSMYDNDKHRPIGRLYRAANSPKPVLVVKSDK